MDYVGYPAVGVMWLYGFYGYMSLYGFWGCRGYYPKTGPNSGNNPKWPKTGSKLSKSAQNG